MIVRDHWAHAELGYHEEKSSALLSKRTGESRLPSTIGSRGRTNRICCKLRPRKTYYLDPRVSSTHYPVLQSAVLDHSPVVDSAPRPRMRTQPAWVGRCFRRRWSERVRGEGSRHRHSS